MSSSCARSAGNAAVSALLSSRAAALARDLMDAPAAQLRLTRPPPGGSSDGAASVADLAYAGEHHRAGAAGRIGSCAERSGERPLVHAGIVGGAPAAVLDKPQVHGFAGRKRVHDVRRLLR